MRYVPIDAVEPGQFLGKTIFSGNGSILLSANVQLTVYMINTLKRIGVTMLYIKDENFDDVDISDPVSEETKRVIIHKMCETFETIRSGKMFSAADVSKSVERLVEEVVQNKGVLVQLNDIRSHDNDQFLHAINVCMIATVIGMNMNLSMPQLKELAIGALLHDIGKVGQEEDGDIRSQDHHTWRGFHLLKDKKEFSLLIAHIALQHHEMLDASGFPRGLSEDKIHQYAKIVAVANTYDNFLYNPVTGQRMLPHEACERLSALAGKQLDHEVVLHFLKTVSAYPNGTSVRLSTNEIGVVVGQHRGLPMRPIVRIIKKHADGEVEAKEVDLAKETTVFIEAVLN